MKTLIAAAALLVLVGCCPQSKVVAPAPEFVGQATVGDYYSVTWDCEEKLSNDKVIWIECSFRNKSQFFYAESTCIEVGYTENVSDVEVEHSRKVCSGVLEISGTAVNYAAFIKKPRENLISKCGLETRGCYMTSKSVSIH